MADSRKGDASDTALSEENARLRQEIETLRLRQEKAQLEFLLRQSVNLEASQDLKQMWLLFALGVFGTLGLLFLLTAIF